MKSGITGQAGRGTSTKKGISSTRQHSPGAPLFLVSSSPPETLLVPEASSQRRDLNGGIRSTLLSASSLRPPGTDLGPPPSARQRARGSKIPVRLSNTVSPGWCTLPISRSHSLTTLPGEIHDILITDTHQDQAFSPLHTKSSTCLSASSHNLANCTINPKRSSESRKNHVSIGRQTQRHRQSSRSHQRHRHASLVTCNSSLCTRLDSTGTQDHDPYETPHYYTFHLTLRSSSNGTRRGRSLTPNRCGRNHHNSNNTSSESDKSKTEVTSLIFRKHFTSASRLEGKAVANKNKSNTSCRCSELGMNNPENSDIISGGRDIDEDRAENNTVHQKEDDTAASEGTPRDDTEKHDINQTFTTQNLEETDGEEASDQDQRLNRKHPSAKVKCICFGIVDYLNVVLQEVEQDTFWESWCGDYGPMLTSAPPTSMSDSESGIEPLAVSLKLPLNYSSGSGYGSGDGTPRRNNQSIKLLRWKSCQELSPHRRPRTLKRQLTDYSFQGRLSAGMVEVYDGNLGISMVPLSIGNNNDISPRLRNKIIARIFSGDKGKVRFKGPASSPPSLVHLINEVHFADEKSWEEHNNKNVMCLNNRPLGDGGKRVLGTVKAVHEVDEECAYVSQKEETKREVPSTELDCVLGIQEDDGNGPGLSEDEMQEEWPTSRNDRIASKPLWTPVKETHHRTTNEASVRRLHPQLSHAGKTASKAVLIAPPDYRLLSPAKDSSRVPRHYSGGSRQSSTRSHLSDMYSQGTSSAEDDSDTGAELSELERRVLTLSHRRSQLRKQDTNAYLIAPPEFKIAEDLYPKGLHGMPEF